MKKIRTLLLLLYLLLNLLFLINLVHSQGGGVSIGLQIIDTAGPIVNLIEPINNSGDADGNITFSYNVSDASSVSNCSLIVNNKINITLTSITKNTALSFKLNNTAIGIYNWSINCTDSLSFIGESSKRIVTHVSTTKFNGSTANLSSIDLRSITNLILEISDSGKINFSESVDLSVGLDLNQHIAISFNKIELNSTALPQLNKSATLELVGLTFSNPRILRDGAVCPSSICTKVSYSGGTLIFNVTQFSAYSSEETPGESASPAPSSGGGAGGGGVAGGGGGVAIPVKTDFSIDKTILKVVLKQGQTKAETFSIKNTGTTIFDVKAFLTDIGRFKVSPEANEITTTLQPNEEKAIEIVFKALENEKPDIYPAKIKLKGLSIEKEVDTVIEVDSAQPLFDVDVNILPESKKVFPGEELLLEVNLFNVRGFGRVDVTVEYAIKDFKGNIVASEHETLAVETQAKFTRALLVPSYLTPENYVALVKVTYGDSVGTSSDVFEVKAKSIRLYPIQIKDYKTILIIGIVILMACIFIFSVYRFGHSKKRAPKAKEWEIKQIREEIKEQKLRKELTALEQARKSGFISEESYQKDKKRIEAKLKT